MTQGAWSVLWCCLYDEGSLIAGKLGTVWTDKQWLKGPNFNEWACFMNYSWDDVDRIYIDAETQGGG